jgi:hypothetical protein
MPALGNCSILTHKAKKPIAGLLSLRLPELQVALLTQLTFFILFILLIELVIFI